MEASRASQRSRARQALQSLLKALFPSDGDLQSWLRQGPDEDIVDSLPSGNPSRNALVEELVRNLESHGRLSEEFFARLRDARPRRASEITEVAEVWRHLPSLWTPVSNATPQWPFAILCLGASALFFTGVSFGLAQILPADLVLAGAAGLFLLSVAFVFLYERRIKESLAAAAIGIYSLPRRTLVASIASGGAAGVLIGDELASDVREQLPRAVERSPAPGTPTMRRSPSIRERAVEESLIGSSTTGATTSGGSAEGHDAEALDKNTGELICEHGSVLLDKKCRSCPNGTALILGGTNDKVTISPFCMDIREVSAADFEKCIEKGVCSRPEQESIRLKCTSAPGEEDKHRAINCVTWEQANSYCRWRGGSLPSATQWEWAARGREEGRRYPWGNDPPPSCDIVVMARGGIDGCGDDRPKPVPRTSKVRRRGISRDGVFDLSGNVAEWTTSKAGEKYAVRGGSFASSSSSDLSSSASILHVPNTESAEIGMRCVRRPQ